MDKAWWIAPKQKMDIMGLEIPDYVDQATTSWGTISHIGILDALTTGNLLYHTPLTTSKAIDTGDIFKIASGSLSVTLA